MLENFIFENHLGQRFEGLANGVYLNSNDLRDYRWRYDIINSRISRFYRNTTDRKLPLTVICKTDAEAVNVKNRLMEIAEVDIEAMLPGKIIVGDYYTKGYITASVKSRYAIKKRFCRIELTLTSEDPVWFRERTYSFFSNGKTNSPDGGSDGTDYPWEYKWDYINPAAANRIVCDSVRDNAFAMKIYGEITNPAVTVGGHLYAVNGTVKAGETLLIDSLTKTITLTKATGEKENWFDVRDRSSYIFKPIPPGQHFVAKNGTFGVDLTVIEKRSEPKWT